MCHIMYLVYDSEYLNIFCPNAKQQHWQEKRNAVSSMKEKVFRFYDFLVDKYFLYFRNVSFNFVSIALNIFEMECSIKNISS